MKKSLQRVLERLRKAITERFGRPSSIRGGLQLPQRLQTAPQTLTRARPRG
jgi:hypothetical protein